jgi:hypothetical protein
MYQDAGIQSAKIGRVISTRVISNRRTFVRCTRAKINIHRSDVVIAMAIGMSASGHSPPARAGSRRGDVGCLPIATDFSGAAKFRHVPLSDLALSQYDFAETVGKG